MISILTKDTHWTCEVDELLIGINSFQIILIKMNPKVTTRSQLTYVESCQLSLDSLTT